MVNVVEKHTPRTYNAFIHNGGMAICSDQDGAITCIRFIEELERLKALLNEVDVVLLSSENRRDV